MCKRGYPGHMAIFMMSYYITNCMYQSYMSLYYTSLNFKSGQIGAINAGVAVASLIAQPVWGVCGDRVSSQSRLLGILALTAGAIALTFRLSKDFLPLLLLAGLFSCFYTAIQPMGDAVVLKKLEEKRQPFGPLRLAGCVAFAVAGMIFGRLLDGADGARFVPVYVAALCAVTAVATLSLPNTPGGQCSHGRRISFAELLKEKELMRLLALMTPVQITMGYFYTFFSPHFVSLPGGDGSLLGICYLISAVGEIPFLLLSDKLFDRFGPGRLMLVSAAALTARWLILSVSRSVPIVMASQLLHGWGFIVMTVCMAKYISRTVPEELRTSGQMLLAIVSFGIARVMGNLGGGILADVIGRQRVFLLASGICAVTFCGFAPCYLKRRSFPVSEAGNGKTGTH